MIDMSYVYQFVAKVGDMYHIIYSKVKLNGCRKNNIDVSLLT